jgi:hypothetical protein
VVSTPGSPRLSVAAPGWASASEAREPEQARVRTLELASEVASGCDGLGEYSGGQRRGCQARRHRVPANVAVSAKTDGQAL